MKKVLVVVLLVLVAGVAWAKNWHETNHAGKYLVIATIPNSPPKVGENPIKVVVRDEAGFTVTDAKVFIAYDMPGMNHDMKEVIDGGLFTKDLSLSGGNYTGVLNLTMPGEWMVNVKTVRDGKTYTADYKVTVK